MNYLEKAKKQAFDKRRKEKAAAKESMKRSEERESKIKDLKIKLKEELKQFHKKKGIIYIEEVNSHFIASIAYKKEKLLSFEVGWKHWESKYSDDTDFVSCNGAIISIFYHNETMSEYDYNFRSRSVPKISEHYCSENLVDSCMQEVADYLSKYF